MLILNTALPDFQSISAFNSISSLHFIELKYEYYQKDNVVINGEYESIEGNRLEILFRHKNMSSR
jgi:hypothetical protein